MYNQSLYQNENRKKSRQKVIQIKIIMTFCQNRLEIEAFLINPDSSTSYVVKR